jgi:hypothetical protein
VTRLLETRRELAGPFSAGSSAHDWRIYLIIETTQGSIAAIRIEDQGLEFGAAGGDGSVDQLWTSSVALGSVSQVTERKPSRALMH